EVRQLKRQPNGRTDPTPPHCDIVAFSTYLAEVDPDEFPPFPDPSVSNHTVENYIDHVINYVTDDARQVAEPAPTFGDQQRFRNHVWNQHKARSAPGPSSSSTEPNPHVRLCFFRAHGSSCKLATCPDTRAVLAQIPGWTYQPPNEGSSSSFYPNDYSSTSHGFVMRPGYS
ncbi:hypothetical protein HDV05_001516, partial [Chytridiales sp. JEL 0842]